MLCLVKKIISDSTLIFWDMSEKSIPKLDSLLLSFLEDKGMAHLRRYRQVFQKIEKVVNPLLKELKKRDKRLEFEPMSSCGYFQVLRRNVLEVFVVFKKLDASKVSFVEMDSPFGTAFVGIKATKLHKKWADLIQGGASQGFFLSSSILREYMNSFLQDISMEKGVLGSNVWYHCTNNDEEGLVLSISYEGEQFFVHLTPAIFLREVWPKCAAMWKTVLFRWPDDGVRERIVNEGVHLTCQPVKSNHEHSSLFWRINFAHGEKLLLQSTNTGCRNKCLQITKTLLEETLSYPIGLTPYHLETVTLHLNYLITSPTLWLEENLGPRFLDLLSTLYKSLTQGSCSNFFAPSVELFSDVSPSALKTLSSRVKRILDFPVFFFQTFERGIKTTEF